MTSRFTADRKTSFSLSTQPASAGKVVVKGTGQPLALASVALQPVTPGIGYFSFLPGTNLSAADGSFQITDVPAGSYRIEANFTNQPVADWVADSVPVTVAAGQTVPDVQLQAYKGGVLEVTVRGKKNHGLIADASVSVNRQEDSHASVTGTNGMALFRVPPGQFNVYANKEGWSPAQTQATATEGKTTTVTIDLGEPFKVSGVVRNAAGAPVAGASVNVFPDYSGMAAPASEPMPTAITN